MSNKMSINEFKNYIADEAIKLYNIEIFKESKKLKENIAAEPTKEQEVYDEIEMRMRPSNNRLPYDEIVDIGEEYGVDVEIVANIMFQYVSKRDAGKENDLKQTVQYIIDQDFSGEAPDFKTFYTRFLDYDESLDYGTTNISPVKKVFDSLTKDPDQLSLDIQEIKEKAKKEPKNKSIPSKSDSYTFKSKSSCGACGGTKRYVGPETGGWESCFDCGSI